MKYIIIKKKKSDSTTVKNISKSAPRPLRIFKVHGVEIEAYSKKDAIMRYNHKYKNRISLNRKGGKRTHNIGTRVYKTKHYRIIYLRCGKIIKKK